METVHACYTLYLSYFGITFACGQNKIDMTAFCVLIIPETHKKKTERREKHIKIKELSGVGFEPTPTRVDCDLNAAP